MKVLYCLLLIATIANVGHAQIQPVFDNVEVGGNVARKTPQDELEDVVLYLSERKSRAPYLRFFTTYAIPEHLRENAVLTLSFTVHSLAGISNNEESRTGAYYPIAKLDEEGNFQPIQNVPDSTTLWWIDIRDYGWTLESWEKVSSFDGYIVEPIVHYEENTYLKFLSGNALLRADWFIDHSLDQMKQIDNGINETIYDTLLYANTGKPTTGDGFKKIWSLDTNKARERGNEFGTLSKYSQAVARHQRMLFLYRTELGWGMQSYDVKTNRGKRNFQENIFQQKIIGGPPDVFDANEYIFSNPTQMQVFALTDGQDNLVPFADPAVARHMSDVLGDARVRVATSCIDCHAGGPIPAENIFQTMNQIAKTKIPKRGDYQRFNRAFLSDKFEDGVEQAQIDFAKALLKVNGTTPEVNHKNYLELKKWYNQDVELAQAAFECGVDTKTFKIKLGSSDYKFGTSLKEMVNNNGKIPRDFWESPSVDGIPGAFQQSMIILNGLTQITESEELVKLYTVKKDLQVYSGVQLIGWVRNGEEVEILFPDESGHWTKIRSKDLVGYVKSSSL